MWVNFHGYQRKTLNTSPCIVKERGVEDTLLFSSLLTMHSCMNEYHGEWYWLCNKFPFMEESNVSLFYEMLKYRVIWKEI